VAAVAAVVKDYGATFPLAPYTDITVNASVDSRDKGRRNRQLLLRYFWIHLEEVYLTHA